MKKPLAFMMAMAIISSCTVSFAENSTDTQKNDFYIDITTIDDIIDVIDTQKDTDILDVIVEPSTKDAPDVIVTPDCTDDLIPTTMSDATEYITETPFPDIKGKWYEEYVNYAYANGLLKGCEDTLFHGDDNITVAELGTILYRLTTGEEPVIAEAGQPWYQPVANWLVNDKQILTVIPWEAFDGEKAASREEIITMLYINILNTTDNSKATTTAPDYEEVDPFSLDAINWALNTGILVGDETGKINPKANVTRAETATLLKRAIDGNTFYVGDNEPNSEEPTTSLKAIETPIKTVGLANPMKEYKTTAEAAAAIDLTIQEPKLEGLLIDSIYTINEVNKSTAIIELNGTYNGENVCLRYGLGDRNISGIYPSANAQTYKDAEHAIDYLIDDFTDGYGKFFINAKWKVTTDDTIYSYSATLDNGDVDKINEIVTAMIP